MHSTDNKIINVLNYVFKKIYNIVHNMDQDESHIQHHTIVNNNGNVNFQDDGMFFDIKNVPILTISGFIIYYSISKLFRLNHSKNEYKVISFIFLIMSILYYLLWNILHPSYHKYEGYENNSYQNSKIYNYLEKYHMIHHLNKGKEKTNFNIILPGIDFLFGTYKGCVDNTEYCKGPIQSEKDRKLCENQEKQIPLPFNIEYCN